MYPVMPHHLMWHLFEASMASINISMSQVDQNAICESCALPDCVGRDCRDCPMQVEQRRRWRAINQQRQASGYFATRDEKLRAERAARRELTNG